MRHEPSESDDFAFQISFESFDELASCLGAAPAVAERRDAAG